MRLSFSALLIKREKGSFMSVSMHQFVKTKETHKAGLLPLPVQSPDWALLLTSR